MTIFTPKDEPTTASLATDVQRLRRTSRIYAVIAVAALLTSGGAVTWAAATIGSAQIIDSSIRSRDIRNGQVRSADIGVNAVGDRELAKVPAVRVERTSSFAVPTGFSSTPIAFVTEDFDTGSMWNRAKPTEIVVPRTGVYVVAGAGIVNASIGTDTMFFQINVLNPDASTTGYDFEETNSTSPTASPSTVVKLQAGAKVRMTAVQVSGATKFIDGAKLSVGWVGPAS